MSDLPKCTMGHVVIDANGQRWMEEVVPSGENRLPRRFKVSKSLLRTAKANPSKCLGSNVVTREERKSTLLVCGHCHTADAKLKKCSRCRQTYYCSTKCQTGAWGDHKKHCLDVGDLVKMVPAKTDSAISNCFNDSVVGFYLDKVVQKSDSCFFRATVFTSDHDLRPGELSTVQQKHGNVFHNQVKRGGIKFAGEPDSGKYLGYAEEGIEKWVVNSTVKMYSAK